MRIRCPDCGELIRRSYSACPYCGYPEGESFPDTLLQRYDGERDKELYDDLFDAHSKLAEHEFSD